MVIVFVMVGPPIGPFTPLTAGEGDKFVGSPWEQTWELPWKIAHGAPGARTGGASGETCARRQNPLITQLLQLNLSALPSMNMVRMSWMTLHRWAHAAAATALPWQGSLFRHRSSTQTGGPDDDEDDDLRFLMPILALVITLAVIFS
jgi:hypothetical protein